MATMPAPELYQAYWEAIARRVCTVCLDQAADGSCGLSRRTCALQWHLPLIVEAVGSVVSNRLDEYVEAVEARVCTRCSESGADGSCALRDRGECALSTYISLVVDAVEEVRARR